MQEIWKQHPKIDENYEFSNLGNFRRVNSKVQLKKTINISKVNAGYFTLLKLKNSLERKHFKLHRIIAEIFVFNDDIKNKIIVKHIDGDRYNNNVKNLLWVSEEESLAIDMVRTARDSGKFSSEEVIQLREEFEETDVNIFDLAAKTTTTPATISKLLKYQTYPTIQPEKKYSYRINILTGKEYDEFFKLKLSEKTSSVYFNKLKEPKNDYKNKNKKPTRKSTSIFYMSNEDFQPIYDDYINSGLELHQLFKKYNIKIGHLNHNKKLYQTPQVNILENEEFIFLNKHLFVSNLGRFLSSDKSRILYHNILSEDIAKKIARKLGYHFLNLKHTEKLENIDGNPYNIKLENLRVKPNIIIAEDVIEKIKYDYINTKLTKDELAVNYGVAKNTVIKLLTDCKKKKMCLVCGTDDPEDFLCHNGQKRCDECTDKNPKSYKNLNLEERKEKIKAAREWAKVNQLRVKLLGARNRAKLKGIEFDLDEEFVINLYHKQNGKCFYSGLPISMDFNNEVNIFSIDRIDSNLGYLKDNICLTNKHINTMKLNLSLEEFFHFIKSIYEFSNLNLIDITEPKF